MIIKLVLAIIIWAGICILQLVLLGIARFFEKTSEKRTWYELYMVSFTLTAIGAGRYIIRIAQNNTTYPEFVGDPLANIFLFIAGLLLLGLGNFLYERMMGESKDD